MKTLVNMVFGSHLYGTNSESSDKDYKGVFMPTKDDLLLQRVPKSINNSTKKDNDKKNTSEDVDTEMYSLNYFIHLACEGETVALDMLHAPSKFWLESSPVWESLVQERERFYTSKLKAFVGYARRQAAKYGVKGSRLSDAKRVYEFLKGLPAHLRVAEVWNQLPEGEFLKKEYLNNPSYADNKFPYLYTVCGKGLSSQAYVHHYLPMLENFINRYGDRAKLAELNEGVDWKAVSHAFRAAYQVKHILLDGGYTYPLPETPFIKLVKSGALSFMNEVGPKLEELMEELEVLSEKSDLPKHTDRKFWDEWLLEVLSKEV